ncbi:cobalamin B12-binding domain-containing protein [Ornithinimicrobium sp. W1665]|uniref:cobalamin B12-binding domain-containing protein n=1 Tax=Ornithinimicrobium sp. W1665 TaxID=3416666 RepID=UPI003D6B8D77
MPGCPPPTHVASSSTPSSTSTTPPPRPSWTASADGGGWNALVGDLVVPVMREIGLGWERGEVSVAQEHLATQLVRSALDRMSAGWDGGDGPQAWLACPPRELHDLPLLAYGLLLRERGWRVRFFGASTPLHDLRRSVRVHRPEVVVVSGDDPARLRASRVALDLLAGDAVLALGGRAAQLAGADLPGRVLPPDLVLAADRLAEVLAEAESGPLELLGTG